MKFNFLKLKKKAVKVEKDENIETSSVKKEESIKAPDGVEFKNENFNDFSFEHLNIKNVNFILTSLKSARFENVRFRNTIFLESNLKFVRFINCKFDNVVISDSYLRDSHFVDCIFLESRFENTNLNGVDLKSVKFIDTQISSTSLKNADIRNVIFNETFFSGVDFFNTYFYNVNFKDIKYDSNTIGLSLACPAEGSFIGYKKANNKIVKLLITEDSLRSSATSKKCRCSKAIVLSITDLDGKEHKEVASNNSSCFIYKTGELL